MPIVPLRLYLPAVPHVTVMIGAPGAGKTTLAKRLAATVDDAEIISLDGIRARIGTGPGDPAATAAAVTEALAALDQRCADRRTTIMDATNTIPEHRKTITAVAVRHHIPVLAVVLDTPLALCLARQRPRTEDQRVPDERVRAYHTQVRESLPSLVTEDYAGVHIFRRLTARATP